MHTDSRFRNDTPAGYVSPLIRVDSRTVRRSTCWRPDCRTEWARSKLSTVSWLADGRVVAFCHRRIHDDLGYRAEAWRYGEAAA
jgi:hypothetical protein